MTILLGGIMQVVKLLFASLTDAIKARRALKQLPVKTRMTKISGRDTSGCGYAIEVSGADYFIIATLLQRNNIGFRVI